MANAKISELSRSAPVVPGALIPVAVGSENRVVQGQHLLASSPVVQLWGDGDSKSPEGVTAFRWAAARAGLDVWVGGRDFGVGSSGTGTAASPAGLTNATRLGTTTTAIAAAVAAGEIVDIVLTIGTNDAGGSTITSEVILANIRKYHEAIRAAGVRFLIIMAIDPRNGMAAAAAQRVTGVNRAYADYCRAVPDAIYCDPSPYLIDPTSAVYGPIGGAGAAYGAVTADGLHGSTYGDLRKSLAAEPIARRLYRERSLDLLQTGNAYSATEALRGNILGIGGRFTAMGGTASFTNSGTGTITGTPPSTFTGEGTLTGDTSVAYTLANSTELAALLGGTHPCINVALSGTPTGTGNITIAKRFVSFTNPGALRMRGRAIFAAKNLTGVCGVFLSTQNVTPAQSTALGKSGGTSGAHDELPALNGLFALDLTNDFTASGNSGLNFNVRTLANRPLGGSIDLIGMEWRRGDPIPAAAA